MKTNYIKTLNEFKEEYSKNQITTGDKLMITALGAFGLTTVLFFALMSRWIENKPEIHLDDLTGMETKGIHAIKKLSKDDQTKFYTYYKKLLDNREFKTFITQGAKEYEHQLDLAKTADDIDVIETDRLKNMKKHSDMLMQKILSHAEYNEFKSILDKIVELSK